MQGIKKIYLIRIVSFTKYFLISLVSAEMPKEMMAQMVNRYTVRISLEMKIFIISIIKEVFYPWLIKERIQIPHNFR